MIDQILIIIQIAVLIFAVIIHEVSHGYVARYFGDPTAYHLGRLTLNPIPHIDIFGSVILPALLIFSGSGFLIGWAKPVPINPRYFQNPERDLIWVSLAGPLSNITLAMICSFIYKILKISINIQNPNFIILIFLYILVYSIQINLILAIFNLLPIPPLDGSKIFSYFLPYKAKYYFNLYENYGFLIIFALAYFGFLRFILITIITPLLSLLI